MKSRIDGKWYNTETATRIGRYDTGIDLYQRKDGEYFIKSCCGSIHLEALDAREQAYIKAQLANGELARLDEEEAV